MSRIQRSLPKALAELFREWQPDDGDGTPEVEAVFSAGHSNRNFLVRHGERRFVVRLSSGNDARLGVDRRAERRALERAEQIGLGAPVLYCNPAQGTLVTEWLESRPLRVEGIGAEQVIDRLAGALRLLHAQDLDLRKVNVADRIRSYARGLQNDNPRNWPRARKWLAAARPVLEQYRFARWQDALCHNDLVAQNILDVGGRVRLIDWEYAGRGDPYFDLATLAEDNGFDALDRRSLLLAYGEFGDAGSERLYRTRVLYRLLSVLWYLVRYRSPRPSTQPQLLRQEQALENLLKQGPDD